MNSDRRKQIDVAIKALEEAKRGLDNAKGALGAGIGIAREALDGIPIEDILSEEQEAFENMSESLQGSEKGQVMEEAIGLLESAEQQVEEVDEFINDVEELFDTAIGKCQEAIDALQSAKGE